jgi:hypothetical protein
MSASRSSRSTARSSGWTSAGRQVHPLSRISFTYVDGSCPGPCSAMKLTAEPSVVPNSSSAAPSQVHNWNTLPWMPFSETADLDCEALSVNPVTTWVNVELPWPASLLSWKAVSSFDQRDSRSTEPAPTNQPISPTPQISPKQWQEEHRQEDLSDDQQPQTNWNSQQDRAELFRKRRTYCRRQQPSSVRLVRAIE